MASKEHVVFVILSWNSEQYIQYCLESVLAINSYEVSLYLVDNGSSDATIDIIKRIDDKRIKLFPQATNTGTTASRNLALCNITEDFQYICILDSDTIVTDFAIKTLVDTLRLEPSIGIVGPIMEDLKGDIQQTGRNLPTVGIKLRKASPFQILRQQGEAMETPCSEIKDGLQRVPYLLSACWLLRKDVLNKVGLLDEHIFYAPEDVDYCVRVQRAGYQCVLCHNARIVHAYQRLSKKKFFSKTNFEHIKGLFYYFYKYGYLFDSSKVLQLSDGKAA